MVAEFARRMEPWRHADRVAAVNSPDAGHRMGALPVAARRPAGRFRSEPTRPCVARSPNGLPPSPKRRCARRSAGPAGRRRPRPTRRRWQNFVPACSTAATPRLSSPAFLGGGAALRRRRRAQFALADVVKLAAPGMPDIYQGTEFYDFSLVDPDNRRSVDFASRRPRRWAATRPGPGRAADWRTGRSKAKIDAGGLAMRRAHPELFTRGPMCRSRRRRDGWHMSSPLPGTDEERGQAAITIAPRLCLTRCSTGARRSTCRLRSAGGDVVPPARRASRSHLRNMFTGAGAP